MGRKVANYFKMGDWNAICDYCAGKFKASELKEDWKGLMACARDWEPRHPQDFVRGVPDIMSPPWIRPRLEPIFVDVTAVNPPLGTVVSSPTGQSTSVSVEAIAGGAVAGDFGLSGVAGEAIAGVGTSS